MGKQTGPEYRTGTIGPVTYFKLFGDHYYLRSKSTLTAKRFFSDRAFERSRKRSKEFGGAACLASEIYQLLPKQKRGRGFMGKLIGKVHRLMMKGYAATEIKKEALREFGVAPESSAMGIAQVNELLNGTIPTVRQKWDRKGQPVKISARPWASVHTNPKDQPLVIALRI